jgi:hypothetical protein
MLQRLPFLVLALAMSGAWTQPYPAKPEIRKYAEIVRLAKIQPE